MAYIGRQLVRGQNRILDDISSSFNGSTTAFNLTVSSSSSPPASVNQLWIILGGILQKPGTDFTVADAVLTFTTAPASTLSFWGMIQGDTSDINSPADASVTPSKIANSGDFAFPADVRFNDADGSHYVGLQAPSTVSSNLVWTLPATDGSANQLLKTDGSGALGWASDTQSNLLDEDNMSSNSATQPASQQSIKAYADTKAVLTGSTNNTITTVTGAHAIQGEANLTYDGSHLSIATDAHGEGIKLTASGSTYSGITFDANRSGADEYMGALEAKWNGSLVSFISFETGSDTTNKDDGLIAFSTRTSGSSIAERMRLDNAGRLIVGHTASSGQDRIVQVIGTTSDTSAIEIRRHSADASSPKIDFSKSRNATKGSSTIVNDGDTLGQIVFRADDGTDFTTPAATISAAVDGTPGANDMPGRLVFNTTADGANSVTERMRINKSGKVGIRENTPLDWLHISTTGNAGTGITLKATDGTYPMITSDANRSGADEYLLNLVGKWNGNECASIQFQSGADTTNKDEGLISFRTNSGGGSNNTERMRINKDGKVGINYAEGTAFTDWLEINTTGSSDTGMTFKATGSTYNTMRFNANRSGTDEYLGALKGQWNGNNVAMITLETGADTTNKDDGEINFWTSSAGSSLVERLSIANDGNVAIKTGNIEIATSGKGIDFSATSDGSGTDSSELFADYEEGTWTPNFQNVSVSSYNSQGGRYTKVGRYVYCTGVLNVASGLDTTDGSAINIGGLPYTGNSDHEVCLFTFGRYTSLLPQAALDDYKACRFGGDFILLVDGNNGGVDYSQCNASGTLQFSFCYQL